MTCNCVYISEKWWQIVGKLNIALFWDTGQWFIINSLCAGFRKRTNCAEQLAWREATLDHISDSCMTLFHCFLGGNLQRVSEKNKLNNSIHNGLVILSWTSGTSAPVAGAKGKVRGLSRSPFVIDHVCSPFRCRIVHHTTLNIVTYISVSFSSSTINRLWWGVCANGNPSVHPVEISPSGLNALQQQILHI